MNNTIPSSFIMALIACLLLGVLLLVIATFFPLPSALRLTLFVLSGIAACVLLVLLVRLRSFRNSE